MKLIRYGQAGQEKPGIVARDGTWRDVSALTSGFTFDLSGGRAVY